MGRSRDLPKICLGPTQDLTRTHRNPTGTYPRPDETHPRLVRDLIETSLGLVLD